MQIPQQDQQSSYSINVAELQKYLHRYINPFLQEKCGQDMVVRIEQTDMEKQDHEDFFFIALL